MTIASRRSVRVAAAAAAVSALLVVVAPAAEARDDTPGDLLGGIVQGGSLMPLAKTPQGFTVSVVSATRVPGSRSDDPLVCAFAERVEITRVRWTRVYESGCRHSSRGGNATYEMDPVTWHASASARFTTTVSRDVLELIDGRWQRTALTSERGSVTIDVHWEAVGLPGAYPRVDTFPCHWRPSVCPGAGVVVARRGVSAGSVVFHGLGLRATVPAQQPALMWMDAG